MNDRYSKFDVKSTSGYVIRHPDRFIALGHTAAIPPWCDPNIHRHNQSEEYYLLLAGRLEFLVDGRRMSLQPNEILMVKPGVPHAVIGGEGTIEHFGIRTPDLDDKQIVGAIDTNAPLHSEGQRPLSGAWGHRIPLDFPHHKNCWLIGWGSALYSSQHMILAYLDFPTEESANAGIGTRLQLHLHRKSWEYYITLQGEKILQIEDSLVTVRPGEMLEVPPNVKHNLHSRQAPYLGFTLRVPVEANDKIVFDS